MKERTIEIIKYFTQVNKSIIFKKGDQLKVGNIEASVFAHAILPETISKNFALYDTNEFLGTYSLFKEPNIKFDDDYMIISDGTNDNKIKYNYSSDIGIKDIYDIDVSANNGEPLASFVLKQDVFDTVKKASSVLGLGDFKLTTEGVKLLNIEAESIGNEFNIDVEDFKLFDEQAVLADDYVLIFKELTLIPDTYKVTFYEHIAVFEADNGDVAYYIVYASV